MFHYNKTLKCIVHQPEILFAYLQMIVFSLCLLMYLNTILMYFNVLLILS